MKSFCIKKHIFTAIFFVLATTNFAFSQWQRDSHTYTNLTLYTLNDYFNGSWTVNTDDYRSFGLGGSRTFKKPFELMIDYYGLTMRKGFPEGEGMRLDELSAVLNYRITYSSGFQRFSLFPGAGLFLAGNLRSQTLQNATHRTMGIPEVTMKYATKFLPTIILNSVANYGFTDTIFHGTEFTLSTCADYAIRPKYDSRLEIGVFTSLKGVAGDLFRLDFLNRLCRMYSKDPVLHYVSDAESGWAWRYVVTIGGIYITNEFGINNGFSTGSIGLSLTQSKGNCTFVKEDFTFECGILPGKSGWIAGIKAHPWEDNRFNLKAEYNFMVPEDIEYPEFRMNQQQLTFGGEFSLFPVKQHLTITPFTGIEGGILRGMRFSGIIDTLVEVHSSPVIAAELGIRIAGAHPNRFFPANVIYGISVSDRFTYSTRSYSRESSGQKIIFVAPYNSIPIILTATVDY